MYEYRKRGREGYRICIVLNGTLQMSSYGGNIFVVVTLQRSSKLPSSVKFICQRELRYTTSESLLSKQLTRTYMYRELMCAPNGHFVNLNFYTIIHLTPYVRVNCFLKLRQRPLVTRVSHSCLFYTIRASLVEIYYYYFLDIIRLVFICSLN